MIQFETCVMKDHSKNSLKILNYQLKKITSKKVHNSIFFLLVINIFFSLQVYGKKGRETIQGNMNSFVTKTSGTLLGNEHKVLY